MDKCKTERVLEGVCATPQNTVLRLWGWRGGGLIHGIDIGGAVHEQPHDVDVPKPRGFHQGGRPILSARWRRRREAHMKTPAATWSRCSVLAPIPYRSMTIPPFETNEQVVAAKSWEWEEGGGIKCSEPSSFGLFPAPEG